MNISTHRCFHEQEGNRSHSSRGQSVAMPFHGDPACDHERARYSHPMSRGLCRNLTITSALAASLAWTRAPELRTRAKVAQCSLGKTSFGSAEKIRASEIEISVPLRAERAAPIPGVE